MERFDRVKKARERFGETNDCSVIATSIAARVPYNVAHAALKAQGRNNRNGTTPARMLKALEALGCEWEQVTDPRQANGSRYTMKTIGQACRRGFYIVLVNGHVAAVVNGQVEDWTNDRRHHVRAYWKVTVPKGSRS